MSAPRSRLGAARRLLLAAPTLWLAAFFVTPLLIVAKVSLSETTLARPPYKPPVSFESWPAFTHGLSSFTGEAWRGFFADPLYPQAYAASLAMAGFATLCACLIALPLALAIARSDKRWRPILIGLAVAPFWTSFLVRVYAWIALLKDEGLINRALLAMGLIDTPLTLFATPWAVIIGMVYSYLPFVILPVYTALAAQDPALREAAADLGASPPRIFLTVTLPLARSGLIAGALLMFIPAVGEFVIPDLLGGSDSLMIGRIVWNDFFQNRDWPTASVGALALLAALVVPLVAFERRMNRARR